MKIEASKRLKAAKAEESTLSKKDCKIIDSVVTDLEDIQHDVNKLLDSMQDADASESENSLDAAKLKKIRDALDTLKPAISNAKGAINEATKAWKKAADIIY